jgi:hypothetical protein
LVSNESRVALEVSDLAAGAGRGGRDDVVDRAHAAGESGDRVVAVEVDELGAHARVVVVGLRQGLRVAAGGDHRRARGAGGLGDGTRDPAAAADHQHRLVVQR